MLHFPRPVLRFGSGVAIAAALAASVLNTGSVAAASQSPVASTSLSNSTVTTPTVALCGASASGQVTTSTALSNAASSSPSCTPQPGQILVIVIGANSTNASTVPTAVNAVPGVLTLTQNQTQNTSPTQLQSSLPNQPQQNTENADMSKLTDVRIDTYAKRQAIRDQYRGRMNETTFNDELGDGVGLDQALSDALREFNAK